MSWIFNPFTKKQDYYESAAAGNAGEGHITILPWNYSAIIQGNWLFGISTANYCNGSAQNPYLHAQNDQLDYKVYLDVGTYNLRYVGIMNTNHAIITVLIDGTSVGTMDMYGTLNYAAIATLTNISIITAGLKTLSLKGATKNDSSTNYYMTIELITLWRTA